MCVWPCILGLKNFEILYFVSESLLRYLLFWNEYIYSQIRLANKESLCTVVLMK